MSMYRLRTEFQFAIVTLFGVVATLGILPFAVYRFLHGQNLAGTIDVAIVLCIVAGVVHAWRGGDLDRGGMLIVATNTIGCLLIAHLLGLPGTLWMYPLLLANFLLTSRDRALVVSALGVGLLVLDGHAFDSVLHRVMFVVTASVVSLFAWIFAQRTARQRRQLESLAARDPLTGIGNRRAMEQELQLAIEAYRRHLGSFGLALLDLDHFKRINDSYGHDAGDETLVAFTQLVQQSIRKLDRFYRIGGEEFVLLLPGVSTADLLMICGNLRVKVAAGLRCRDQPVTVSIGAAGLHPGEDAAAWLARADTALYRAKRGGRNRVELEDGTSESPIIGVEPGESSLRGS